MYGMSRSRFEDLRVWRDASAFALDLSRLARQFPADERFELAAQLRRAARSIPANIAEGAGSQTPATFLRHIGIALGSTAEVENHLICARDEGYITAEVCHQLRERAGNIRGLLVLLARSLARAKIRK
jgi:four helix bundle protein